MTKFFKGLTILIVGIAIWSLSLIWPEVNLVLTEPIMVSMAVGSSLIVAGLAVWGYIHYKQLEPELLPAYPEKPTRKSDRPRHPSRPMQLPSH